MSYRLNKRKKIHEGARCQKGSGMCGGHSLGEGIAGDRSFCVSSEQDAEREARIKRLGSSAEMHTIKNNY